MPTQPWPKCRPSRNYSSQSKARANAANKRKQMRLTPALTEIRTTSQAPPIFSPQSPAELQRASTRHTDARRCMSGKWKKKGNLSTTMSAASTLRLQHHHCHRLVSQSGAPNKPHTLVPQAPILQSALRLSHFLLFPLSQHRVHPLFLSFRSFLHPPHSSLV